MLTRVDLQYFKCFETLKLPLCSLTLLSGINASGKSSVMQALVLLHQTMREHEWSSRLMLNGNAIRLGTTADVIDQVHGRRSFGIALMDGAARFHWRFTGERDAMSMAVEDIRGETGTGAIWIADAGGPLRYLLPISSGDSPTDTPRHLADLDKLLTDRLRRLTYLTAERLGPREHYLLDDPQLTPVVGPQGEYAVSVLYSGRGTHVLERLQSSGVPPTRFPQVEARMRRFFPGCRLAVDRVPRANTVTLGIRISSDMEFLRPAHTGFGLTQVLPIVVAVMSANKDDLLLIENPEVHLHPAGQAEMGEFLAAAAAAGIQVILETHSDHVLNGIRRAVKSATLPPNDVALHFFRPRRENEESPPAQVVSPRLDANGNIDHWPEGFFDQFDKDMSHFAGWS